MIPPPGRCRPGQELNLQLSSFDERVYRSNRPLTASEIEFWEKPGEVPWSHSGPPLKQPAGARFRSHGSRHGTGFDLERSSFTFTAQKK